MPRKSKRKAECKAEDKEEPEEKPVVRKQAKQKPVKKEKAKPVPKKRKSTTDDSITHSKTSSVVLTAKRRKPSNKVNTDSKNISQKEKKAFYECLKDNGISCLNDEPLLQQILPNRSIPEIKAMIDGFSRKAQELNRRSEESVSGIQTDPNGNKQPIEKWFDLIHQMVPNPSKKDDMSAILIDLFDEYRNEFSSDDVLQSHHIKPDYRAVYDCITAALNGKYAKQMEPINAFVVVKLIEELKQSIKNDLNAKELSFLSSGIWWQIPNHTNAQKTDGEIFRTIYSQRQQQNNNELTENNVHINGEVDDQIQSQSDADIAEDQRALVMNEQLIGSNVDNTYETLKTYPKLRKIIECLNPLRVPIEVVIDEYNR